MGGVSKPLIERRLIDNGERVRALRDDLKVADEQLAHFNDEAEDARIRSLVSETPLAEREHRDADRHAQAMQKFRDQVAEEIAALESQQDALLDQLAADDS
jgi:hypothetical protein